MACAGGFVESEMRAEVMRTHAYAGLGDREWNWAIDFVRQGLNEAFKFRNPNVKGECGCGESFNV